MILTATAQKVLIITMELLQSDPVSTSLLTIPSKVLMLLHILLFFDSLLTYICVLNPETPTTSKITYSEVNDGSMQPSWNSLHKTRKTKHLKIYLSTSYGETDFGEERHVRIF